MKKLYLILVSILSLQALSAFSPIKGGSPAFKTNKHLFEGSSMNASTVAGGNGFGNALNQVFPSGLVFDEAGNLYVSDAVNNRVLRFAPGSTQGVVIAGSAQGGNAPDQLYTPFGLARDKAGNIYICDANNQRVQKWAPGATSGTTVVSDRAGNDIAVDDAGNVYVADGFRIYKYAVGSTQGVVVAGANYSGNAPNAIGYASGVFVDKAGSIYIVDGNNYSIQKWAAGASSGTTVAGGHGGGAASNQLSSPRDIFVDDAGNMYISDEGNYRVQKWAPGASEGVTVGGGNGRGAAANQLESPRALVVDGTGAVYVCDALNYRVQKFLNPDAPSNPNTVVGGNGRGPAFNQFNEPNNVFADPAGNLYIADLTNNRIQKFSPGASTGVTVAGGNGVGNASNQLWHPTDVRVDAAGNIFVADFLNNRVQRWAPGATSGTTVAGGNGAGALANQLNMPAGIFVDAAGNIFIADYQNHRIQKWAPGASQGVTVAGGNGAGAAANQLNQPNDVFIDALGNIFIADQNNDRVQKWSPGATSGVTVAGGNGRGNAYNQLALPTGVFLDGAGNIFIADYGNDRVQRWTTGASTGFTVAGGNGPGTRVDQLNGPVNIAIDATNTLFVSDSRNDRIQKFKLAGLSYRYVSGSFSVLPNFNSLTPEKSGPVNNIDIAVRPQGVNDNFAILWEGSINIPTPGEYTFETISDDGSKLFFNLPYSATGASTVNSDGLHAAQSASAKVNVATAGSYPFAVAFFESTGSEALQVYWTGPGIPRQLIPDVAFTSSSSADNTPPNAPTNLKLVNPGGSFIGLDWDDAVDNVGVTAYDVYVNGEKKASTSESKFTVEGLTVNTAYTFAVKARDFAGNVSAFSTTITGSTIGTLSGLNYKYYEGSWDNLPDFATLTPVKTGVSLGADISVRPAGRNDNFAFVWEGYINISAGFYNLLTTSDDGSKIYFNQPYSFTAQALVNNDGLHASTTAGAALTIPTSGYYPITITYFEKDGGEQLLLQWVGTSLSGLQPIPNSAFVTALPSYPDGLSYRCYQGQFLQLPEFNSLVPVKTGNSPNVDINVRPEGLNDNFAFLWEGYINIPTPGEYTFETYSDDGSRFYFNSFYSPGANAIVFNDQVHAPRTATGKVTIAAAGRYPVAITYFDRTEGEVMQVYWSGPGIQRQLIPNSAFVSGATSSTGGASSNSSTAESLVGKPTITKAYPDPFSDRFTVSFYNKTASSNVSVSIHDGLGRKLYTKNVGRLMAGNQTIEMATSQLGFKDGLYFVTVTADGVSGKPMKLVRRGR